VPRGGCHSGAEPLLFFPESAGSAVMETGRTTLAEAPELLLTNTSEDFLRASASLWAGVGGAGAGAGALAVTGGGCGAG